jgi:hypothetical protein
VSTNGFRWGYFVRRKALPIASKRALTVMEASVSEVDISANDVFFGVFLKG